LPVVVGGIAYLGVYLSSHKSLLGTGIGRVLGRQVEVEGAVTWGWSTQPRLDLDGMSRSGA